MSRQIPTLTPKSLRQPPVGSTSNIPKLTSMQARQQQRTRPISHMQSKGASQIPVPVTGKRDIEPRTSFLSPKAVWSPERGSLRQIPKYQLSDPGPVNSRLPITKRRVTSTSSGTTLPLNTPKTRITRSSGDFAPKATMTPQGLGLSRIPRPNSTPIATPSTNIPAPVRNSINGGMQSRPIFQHSQDVQSPTSRIPKPSQKRVASNQTKGSGPGNNMTRSRTPERSMIALGETAIMYGGAPQRVDSPLLENVTLESINTENEVMQNTEGCEKTPIMSSRQTSSSSSIYSSASSLARSRAIRNSHSHQPPQPQPHSRPSSTRTPSLTSLNSSLSNQSESNLLPMRAPYLVPETQEDVTLTWEPDLESGYDEAEEIWKRMEVVLGQGRVGTKGRGRWVVKPRLGAASEKVYEGECEKVNNDVCERVGMERGESGFSLSAYYDDTHGNNEGTYSKDGHKGYGRMDSILFDMKGPLIPSVSSSAATPANTPFFGEGSLRRVGRVHPGRRSRSGDDHGEMGGCMIMEEEVTNNKAVRIGMEDIHAKYKPNTEVLSGQRGAKMMKTIPTSPTRMYRLDSHIISALAAFQDQEDQTSPALDYALSLSASPLFSPGLESPTGGLGLGIHIRMNSIYGLGDDLGGLRGRRDECADNVKGKGKDWWIRDLDTGEVTDVFAA